MKFGAFVLASAAAARQSVVSLSSTEKAILGVELAEWENEFGSFATEHGLLPRAPATESARTEEAILDDKLQRLLDTKFEAELAQEQNPDAVFSWKNPFALLNEAEFKRHVAISFERDGQQFLNGTNEIEVAPPASYREAAVDWSTRCNPPVREQGECLSCWAHAAVGVAEAAHCIATGNLLSLSVQQVTSCSTKGGSAGCNTGFPSYAIDYAAEGLCLDSAWPYRGQTGTCNNQCTKQRLAIGASARTSGESGLLNALYNQPVVVAVASANNVWKNYVRGVVSACPAARSDHAAIAVGYDGQSYKIKNSWGTRWGDGGYIYLRANAGGRGTCNVAEYVFFPKLGASPYQPKPGCGNCNACYYPGDNSCLSDFNKADCEYYSAMHGTKWCAN
ncbi:hypothetical protein DYB38_003964 [Aphanomyces astaci]|uniref:Peptidase C1A papain C-terminal domain-containing protein n=1 Tax=Aphanomyces astaci TaxID=112090 RepID=A0A397D4W9_APHAT|nr:hypothetical protein DYB38_003964 [Aphanomyces astaci]